MMTEQTAIDKIGEFQRFGMILGLERMSALMDILGNPQDKLKVIHVAGTNGKGSVCKFIYEGLQANGYKVGLYTSPYIDKFNERIQFDGAYISDVDLDKYTEMVLKASEEMTAKGLESPTEFEVVTAVAFLYYAQKDSDFVVLEVGLGGTGDSTNMIKKPLICIITSISYDHMDRLGSTLEEIAGEKAGIIKDSVPVVSNVSNRDAAKVIAKKAYEKHSRLYDVTKLSYGITEESIFGYKAAMEIYGTDYSDVEISMTGRHQLENLKTALGAIEVLRKSGIIKVERSRLYKGLKQARQPGRFEVREGQPIYILDGAHNQAGAEALYSTLCHFFPNQKVVMIAGVLKDKQVDEILQPLTKCVDLFIASEPDNPRKLSAEELAKKIQSLGQDCIIRKSAEEAIAAARQSQPEPDVIVAAGSLYLIGQIRKVLEND